MNQPTDRRETDGFATQPAVDKLVPRKSTEHVIEEILAAEPHKHRVSLERYKQLTALRALHAGMDNDQYVFEEHCRAYGLDPMANTGGNRPRYTMGENGVIKDHETGATFGEAPAAAEPRAEASAPVLPGAKVVEAPAPGNGEAPAGAAVRAEPAQPVQSDVRAAGLQHADPHAGQAAPGRGEDQKGERGGAVLLHAGARELDSRPGAQRLLQPAGTGGIQGEAQGRPAAGAHVDEGAAALAREPARAPCDHSFIDPVEAATPCQLCGITFETWANQ